MGDIKTYIEFVNEQKEKYSDNHPRYIDTDYYSPPNDSKQRILNKKDSVKLKILRFIFESGKEGRAYTEIQRFYFELDGKTRLRVEYVHSEEEGPSGNIVDKFTRKETHRGYNSTKDRGMGTTMFYGSDWQGKPTGLLRAYCKKNDNGKWVLTDLNLIDMFEYMDYVNQTNPSEEDQWVIRDLGIFGTGH